MRTVATAFRLQLIFYRHHPDLLVPLLTAPLYSVIFTMIIRHNGRTDLLGQSSLAPFYMSLWWFALFSGGWIIQTDRWEDTLQYLVSAPANFSAVVFGRAAATMVPGTVAFAETWLFARYVLDAPVTIRHWPLLIASFALTLFATAATASLLAAVFVLARNAVTFSNAASFPFYLLGGILVPTALLPIWLRPLSDGVFLSWSADLLRGAVKSGPVPHAAQGLLMTALLGVVALIGARLAIAGVLHRVRHTGELSLR
ncbi:ABC transporter permease [Amycolatopsis sp. GM8]|uniref:ABC transporter permease n=1 Tax=Amycolatopsis sp. GM8 TaxID=2896530 RepID=UPI001F28C5EC|nr:ABC transporter permease [Amycolatopsis sp. GM8]